MVDFFELLKKNLEIQKELTAEKRQKIYIRAKQSTLKTLHAQGAPKIVLDKHLKQLEEAIARLEACYTTTKEQQENPSSGSISPEWLKPYDDLPEKEHTGVDFIVQAFTQTHLQDLVAKKRKKIQITLTAAGFLIVLFLGIFFSFYYHFKKDTPNVALDFDTNPRFDIADKSKSKIFNQKLLADGREIEALLPPDQEEEEDFITFPQQKLSASDGEENRSITYRTSLIPKSFSSDGAVRWALFYHNSTISERKIPHLVANINIKEKNIAVNLSFWKNDNPKINAAYLIKIHYKTPANTPSQRMEYLQEFSFQLNKNKEFQQLKAVSQVKVQDNLFIYAIKNIRLFMESDLQALQQARAFRLITRDKAGQEHIITFEKTEAETNLFHLFVQINNPSPFREP